MLLPAAMLSLTILFAPAERMESPAAAATTPAVWGWDAHKMICQMAYWQVDEQTRARIDELIEMDPEYDRFAESCLWADDVRGRLEQYDRYTTAHYVNLPRGATAFDLSRDCADTYCIVEAIRDTRATLSSDTATDAERLEAFKFLSHFVSDIHQPMHAGYGDDRGGNDTSVTLFGSETNLHAAWDYGLLEHSDRAWVHFATILFFDIDPADAETWSAQLDPERWAEESFAVVAGSAYDLPTDGVIGQEYYNEHIHTLESRMQQAAVRLAAVLTKTLGS